MSTLEYKPEAAWKKLLSGSAFRIGISLLFLAALCYAMRGHTAEVTRTMAGVNPWLFIAALALQIVAIILVALRLRLLFSVNAISFSIVQTVKLTFVGEFFNGFLPSFGGDIVKGYYASKNGAKRVDVYTAVFLDRIFGFFSIFLLAALALLFTTHSQEENPIIYLVLSLLTVFFLIFLLYPLLFKLGLSLLEKLRLTRIHEFATLLFTAAKSYGSAKPVVIGTLLLSIVGKLFSILAVAVLCLSLGAPVSLLNLLWIVPVAFAAGMLPSINGMGVREGAFVYFISGQIGLEMALSVSILWLSLFLFISALGGLAYVLSFAEFRQ